MLVCAAFSGGAGASDAGALLEAARRGDTAQVASLLERKVEVDAPSADGSTPLLLATANDHLAVARQLIEAGADVNRQNSRLDSPYLLAGADINLADADGVSPLAHARQRGQGGIERLLLAAGAQ
ncbi:ankyrin repeat domain-containing protein [Pseudomonas aeruginosa]|uniref:ankyrin repeat domain-containing protein n=1 Tax=Pseudomonas aeruginosa TaxID=287 RepID=UPI0008FC4FCC|nr:ankyrin repeat domain-containing protein [Pseudomonas aeruginosa]APC72788.1 Ankyrin repeats (3 copies) [Pseudomonas aeruginosa]